MKTVKQEEPIARSRFVDCPVCKNHSLRLKRIVQVGRCKSCSETYKVIVVYVKTGRRVKAPGSTAPGQPVTRQEIKPETAPETSLPSLQVPSDNSLFGATTDKYSGLSEAIFGENHKEGTGETGSSGSQ